MTSCDKETDVNRKTDRCCRLYADQRFCLSQEAFFILLTFSLLMLFPNQALSSDGNEWSHKDWTVKSYGSYTKYVTHGERVYGHQFGFLKTPEGCGTDNLWISWSSSDPRVKNLSGTETMLKFNIDGSDFLIPVDLISSVPLFSNTDNKETSPAGLQVMAFTNFIPNANFIALLESGHMATIEIVGPKKLIQYLDLPSENFSMEGFIATKLKAEDWCNSQTTTPKPSFHTEPAQTRTPPIFRGATLGMSIGEYNQLDSVLKGYMPALSPIKNRIKMKSGLLGHEANKCKEKEIPGLFECYFDVSGEIGKAELYNIQFIVFNDRIVDIVISIRNTKRAKNAIENVFDYYYEMYGNEKYEYKKQPTKILINYRTLDFSFWRLLQRGLSSQRPIHYTKLSTPKSQFSVNFMHQPHEIQFFDKNLEANGVIVFRDEAAREEIDDVKNKLEQLNADKNKLKNEIRMRNDAKKRIAIQKHMY